ncbi:hypothetical protein [Robiginitalea aurantiaca]|uniref:Calx-beta domain-containing protein n=1 Tax=Robiginitalea aurantiaca TaxID=3056915 RepID=A0ABT7WFA2_9FLAO|nr:hypothetical protein [Robiginitalea aurantiaca]MDM9631600.1 hypothetical protein [Robiginitalea aurantiaca]
MKKYFYILFASLGMLVSCEEDLVVYDPGAGYLQFSSTSGTIAEGAPEGPNVTTVLVGAGENPNGVTVNFTVTADDPSRFVIEPSSGSLEIPAGEFSGEIVITPIDNVVVDGDMDIVLELTTGSSLPVGIDGTGVESNTRTVTLIDDDCPVDLGQFTGTFDVDEVFTSGVNEGLTLSGAFGQSYQIEMVPQPGDETGTKVVITNSAGFNEYIPDGTVMTLLPCPGAVEFSPLPLSLAGGFADLAIEEAVFNESEGSVTVSGPLGGFGPYEFVLTKQ